MLTATLRPKTCGVCEKEFLPARPMQGVCGPRCAMTKVRAEKARERTETRLRKEAIKTIPDLIRDADKAFEAFIREHAGDGGTVEIYSAPTLGKCEPVYQALQVMAAQSEKWMLKMDVDEWMTKSQLNKLMALATRMLKSDHISAFILPRKNVVDGVDISRVFAHPGDPKGRDWQIRLSFGVTLSYSFASHTHPSINGRWMLVDTEVAVIEHRRTFGGIVRANITREGYLVPQARQNQRAFVARVGELLGKTQDEIAAEVQKYV